MLLQNVRDVFTLGALVGLLAVASMLTGCTAFAGFDYVGKTGKSDTHISKEFVDGPRKISARRY